MKTLKYLLALGVALFLSACEMPWDPVEIEVSSTNFGVPDDAGVIDAERGVKFVFYSNVWPGTTWWGSFQVPVTGDYNIAHTGQPVFEMTIHHTYQSAGIVATPANGETVVVNLMAGLQYYVEAYQPGGAMMGGTAVWVWAD
jgi:hypothetical protein